MDVRLGFIDPETPKISGILTMDDFANYRAIVRPGANVIYTQLEDGRTICGPPPPSGAAVTSNSVHYGPSVF
ncbi:hypothetical protein niasHT_016509 [Heterodera trifolii]|uniref:Uncharacterized protein n=1 Tax=Heterodera trifolii TaxID=157864 RepID=A0ABD2L451_9BILA